MGTEQNRANGRRLQHRGVSLSHLKFLYRLYKLEITCQLARVRGAVRLDCLDWSVAREQDS